MRNILDLINNNNWVDAIKQVQTLFDSISDGKNLFHYACMRGESKIIDHYLSLDSESIYLSDNDGNTGAHHLAINGWDNLLMSLIKKKPMFLQLKNYDGDFVFNLVLHRPETLEQIIDMMNKLSLTENLNSVNHNNENIVLNLIDKIYENVNDANNESQIDVTYFDILKKISKNSSINFNLPKDSPPLIVAISEKKHKVIDFLLSLKDIDVNIESTTQFTPLIVALMKNFNDVVLKLIDMGANVNYGGSENKYIPLNICFKRGYIDIIEKLLTCEKLDYNKADYSLNTPIFYLIYYIHTNPQQYSSDDKLKNILKQMIIKSNMSEVNIAGSSPLHFLVKYDLWKDFEDILKKKDLEIDIIDQKKNTPFSLSHDKDISSFVNIVKKTVSSGNDIKLPKIIESNNNYGIFNSDGVHNVIYMIYVLNNYDKCTIPMQYPDFEKETWEIYKLRVQMIHQSKVIELFISKIMFYVQIFYCILPHMMIWVDRNINFRCKDADFYLQKAIVSDKRFIVIRLSLIQYSLMSHANILVYDKVRNVIVRFEPYGDWEFGDSYFLDKAIIKFFKKVIDKSKHSTLKFLRPSDYLNKTKFQTASFGDHSEHKNLGDPEGYCLAWCYWFLELKLLNPDVDERMLVEGALKKIIVTSDSKDDNPLLSHIRGYAKHLDNEKNKILENMNINKHDFYKLHYDDNKFSTFKIFVNNFISKIYA